MDGLFDKLSLLSRNKLHSLGELGGGAAGFAAGGPMGAQLGSLAGGTIGAGLEGLLTPYQSPFESGYAIGEGGGVSQAMNQQPSALGGALKSAGSYLGEEGLNMGIEAASNKLMPGMGKSKNELGLSDNWLKLMQRVMDKVPREELEQWLESRTQSNIEGAV